MSGVADRPRAEAAAGRPAPDLTGSALRGGRREQFAALVGRVLVLAACWSVISLVARRAGWARQVDDAFALVNLPVGPSLFSVVVLFVVGGAVRRRVRAALWLLLAFQLVAAAYLLGELVDVLVDAEDAHRLNVVATVELVVNAVATVVLVVLLWRSRAAFSARLEPGARWGALVVLGTGLGLSIAASVVLTALFPDRLTGAAHRLAWAGRVALGVEPDATDVGWNGEHGHHWVAVLAGVLSAGAVGAAARVFLRSARATAYLSAQDELTLRGLLLAAGERDSLGYFATRRDKSVVFSARRDAAVTYRVLAAVSLASADPIGARDCWAPAIQAGLGEARRFGWFPAVLSASEDGARAYVAAGLKALPIGDEAVIDVDMFTLRGAAMQPLRRAVHRIQRAGYTITVGRHGELSADELAEIEAGATAWRGDATERGFTMALGRLGDQADRGCGAVLARDPHGRLRGLLSLVPWGRRGLSLDLMRRDPTSENGLIEAMVAALAIHARDELGVSTLSLNFAMFRGVFGAAERVGAGPGVRLSSQLLTIASRFWQIESLYRSNARYQPRWIPRYLCYDSSLTLTRVALAAGSAEGFLPALGRPHERRGEDSVTFDGSALPFAAAVQAQRAASTRLAAPPRRVGDQQRVRIAKLELLRNAGMDPYPVSVPRDSAVADIVARFGALPPDSNTGVRVSICGRVRAWRDLGGLIFVVLQDENACVQAILDRAHLGVGSYQLLRRGVDLGDYLAVTGPVVTSRRGELSVLAEQWQMASKCLRPVPAVRGGAAGHPDAGGRHRHIDLIVNPRAVAMLSTRSAATRAMREFFIERDFLEVETPMLQAIHGGANARPFITHINAYDTELYLRIAPELSLKRLCVGGITRLFELNRNFRNEGADATHNPEFTSLEAYQAYADYLQMRELTRELIIQVASEVHGRPVALRAGADGRVP